MTSSRYWLETRETHVPLAGGSVLIGRNPDCDVVLTSDAVSRHHALVRVVDEGVEVIPLGRRGVTLNGAPCDEARPLGDGDALEVEGHRFVLRRQELADEVERLRWFAERERGVLVALGREPTRVGSGPDDRLVVHGWEPGVMVLHRVGERLVLEALAPPVGPRARRCSRAA